MAAAGALLVLRLRRAEGETRQQLKWVVWAGTIELIEIVTEFLPNNPAAVYTSTVSDTLFVAALALAILRHRLFDIDVVINRTLVFAALTAVVAGLYVAVVVVIAALLGEQPNLGPGLVATALVAVAFAPARTSLQRGVDRLMYGERRNPYGVMTQLGHRLATDDGGNELAVVVDTVTQALKLPYAAIVGPDGERLAESGTPSTAPLSQPLSYQGMSMGELLVQPRERGGGFDRAEHRLLADLARQVGAAVHAVRLSADLQASRTRLVSAKEEERRRLRRDLHDGLGPKLAALGLKLDAAHALVDTRPDASKDVLGKVRDDIRTTIDDVRQLVYGLRPPALDELGLIGALRDCAGRFDTPRIAVEAPQEDLPPLPAAAEVAAYWIVNEALTNVVRHARASRCVVEVCLAQAALHIAIRDDGSGLPTGWRPGVGTSSMRERAAELGGTVSVRTGSGGRGTEVVAVIPA
jgi:signal transduction histidine kinase